ncbi:THAP domain-containing protein 1 isoform X1 [Electrophorus electricus]|uniref:THAP domain-containing protein 1 n=2 Tax=Electrophorus electricus TaxID=8005 RepID=A0AAY5F5B1_ELEEL|nr:THAP domain-containing protein 1 isoform X1 [Electrophorus electricus]
MVQSCSAYGCKNRYHKDKNISFHKFPLARPDVCGKWVAAMKRSNFKPTKYSNICSQHFTKDCFKRECNNRVLKENAVPSLFTFNKLQMKPEMDFPLNRPNPDAQEAEVLQPPDLAPTSTPLPVSALSPATAPGEENLEHQPSAFVPCDHNYTAEDTVQQKKRIEQLEEQLEKLRKKLKTVRQKCRRQERQLERLRAAGEMPRAGKGLALGESYVILPKELFNVLKIDTIDGL